MRIGMNGSEVEAFVERLKAGEDVGALEAASGVDPAWFRANRRTLLELAGREVEAPELPEGVEGVTADELHAAVDAHLEAGGEVHLAPASDAAPATEPAQAPKRRGRPPKAKAAE